MSVWGGVNPCIPYSHTNVVESHVLDVEVMVVGRVSIPGVEVLVEALRVAVVFGCCKTIRAVMIIGSVWEWEWVLVAI